MNSRFVETLLKLHAKTEAGNLKWQTTADENSYRIGLGNGILRVNRRLDRADNNDEQYTAALFNGEGTEVESVSMWINYLQNFPNLEFLKALFEAARRSALDIDNLLDSIDKDIEAGKARPIVDTKGGSDDLPF